MNQAIVKQEQGDVLERVVLAGDLSKLTPADRVSYYNAVCQSVGLNPLTRPLEYITLNNKLTLYARKDATDQLRKIHGVSIVDLAEQERESVYIVTAKAQDASGRTDISKGAVNLNGLKGDSLANAIMKCETKAKRRVTLSICGLGFLDETEISTIPDAKPVRVDEDGTIVEARVIQLQPAQASQVTSPAEIENASQGKPGPPLTIEVGRDSWACSDDQKALILDYEAKAEELGIYKVCRERLELRFKTRNPARLDSKQAKQYTDFLCAKIEQVEERLAIQQQDDKVF